MHEGKEYRREGRWAVALTASSFIVNLSPNVLVDGGDEHGAKASYHIVILQHLSTSTPYIDPCNHCYAMKISNLLHFRPTFEYLLNTF